VTSRALSSLPSADLLAMLDNDAQGWAVAQAVREDGRIVDFELRYLNDSGARILGRPRDELIGRRYRDLWPETMTDGTMPLYVDVVEQRRPAVRTVYYDKQSVAGHFEVRISPCGDGFAACFVDLTQLTVRPRSTAGARLYDVLDAAFDGFVLLRAERGEQGQIEDFVCEYVNQIGAKLAERSPEEIIGRRITEVSPRALETGFLDRYRRVAETGDVWRQEVTDDPSGLVWEIKISRVDVDFVAMSYRDVTERVRQQERIAESEAQAREAAQRTAALQAISAALAAASTPEDVYAVMSSTVGPSAGGQGLAVFLRDENRLVLSHHAGYEPLVVKALSELPLDGSHPAAAAARTGEPRFFASPAEYIAAQPEQEHIVRMGGRQAWAVLPLATAGRVHGTMIIGYRDPRVFSEADRDTLIAFGRQSAEALQRAVLYEAQRSIAADLQRALLPAALPDLRGARHAVRYLPWTHGADVGGDWYDIIPLGPDAVAVVIGDVAGHSPNAAATMGQIRNALRAYAAEGHSPTGVVERVNRLMFRFEPDAMATCCYMEVHLAEGTATAVLAGHPPPVLRQEGLARPLALRTGPPLGVHASAGYIDSSFLLPTGSNLLLYTDGLVEDRRYDINRGLADLCAAVAATPSDDPEAILEHILSTPVGPYPRSDDVAIVALTVDAVPEPGPPVAERRFGGDAASAPAARRFAGDILAAWGEHSLIDNARLLLGEIITNAVQHTVGDVSVRLALGERRLRVEVSDRSDRRPDRRLAGAESESGRGLQIVDVRAHEWGYEPMSSGGKVVWFELDRRG
jgi:GAF domain-containing protein/anti-sigma regulatory factor (Ser/Thr protein kinase)